VKSKNKMRKYSSEDKIDFKDASKELQNLFIFHTPTIKEGVDCSFPNPQDVFLHVTGNSSNVYENTKY